MAKELNRAIGLKNKPIIISNSVYRGREYIDVRKNYIDPSGELSPTRKGITLTSEQWIEIVQILIAEFLSTKNNGKSISNWRVEMLKNQNIELQVEFKNSLTEVLMSEEFKFRLEKTKNEDIIKNCLSAISDILVEYDEIEVLQKVCKLIAMKI
jgi:hypothetical protein